MLFNSLAFLIYFPVVLCVYFFPWERLFAKLTPAHPPETSALRLRQVFLLLASYYFYMCWRADYALLILFSTVLDYSVARLMESSKTNFRRRLILCLSLSINLGLLFFFKYFNFACGSLMTTFSWFGIDLGIPVFDILLPVGISFYTFQSLGYIVDVYRGEYKAEKDFVVFALYVSFFPQLVAGPIERSRNLIPQLHQRRTVTWDHWVGGFSWILWGFFMKTVIADQIAPYVNRVFNAPDQYTGGHFILATIFFVYQIFCDFAGYSFIAVGTAEMMGYKMMQNFKRPFYADSISEFWGRWHISLMTWFRDYLYKALRVKDSAGWRIYFNLFVIYLVSGIWHGAAWTFVLWGLVNWGVLALERLFNQWKFPQRLAFPKWFTESRLKRVLQFGVVFVLTGFPLIFFRSRDINQAFYIWRHLFDIPAIDLNYLASLILPFTSDYSALALGLQVFLSILLLEAVQIIQESKPAWLLTLWKESAWFKGGCLTGLLLIILLFGNFDSQSFIYFQF